MFLFTTMFKVKEEHTKMIEIDVCRCCARTPTDSPVFCLFSSEESISATVNLADLISDCTGISFTAEEINGCFICASCRASLIAFYTWKFTVLDVNERFKESEDFWKEEDVDFAADIIEEYLDEEEEEEEVKHHEEPTVLEIVELVGTDDVVDERLRVKTAREKAEDKKALQDLYKREADGMYHCVDCPHTFQTVGRLVTHLNTEHAFPDQKSFECKMCGEVFPMFKYLKHHHDQIHREKPFTCEICGMTAASRISIRNHIRRMHLGVKRTIKPDRAECSVCNKTFADKAKLAKHVKNLHNHGGVVKPFECPFCQSRWGDRSSFEVHKRTHWDTQAKFPCPQCGKELASKGNLKAHILSVHEQVRNHHCEICSNSFKCARDLREHRATHSDEKPHICEHCGASFRRKDILQGHIKTQHSNLPPVQCDICFKVLKSSFTLKEHKRLHSNVVYNCEFCGKNWGSTKALQKHLKQVHEGERVRHKCLLCNFDRWSKKQILEHIARAHTTEQLGGHKVEDFVAKVEWKKEIKVKQEC